MVVGEELKSTSNCGAQEAEAGGLDFKGQPGLLRENHQQSVSLAYGGRLSLTASKNSVCR